MPVAALVTDNSFTAEAVVENLICSLVFSSPIKLVSSIKILLPLASKLPPNWGVASSTTLGIPVSIAAMSGLVPSLAVAKINLSPLFVAEKVKVVPEPVAYLNWTVKAPIVEFLKNKKFEHHLE